MATVGYESLRTAKAALDEGLINSDDFNEIKTAFLRAQQIKAGLDAGFIREADYQNVKKAFLNSLNLSADPATITSEPTTESCTPSSTSSLQISCVLEALGPSRSPSERCMLKLNMLRSAAGLSSRMAS